MQVIAPTESRGDVTLVKKKLVTEVLSIARPTRVQAPPPVTSTDETTGTWIGRSSPPPNQKPPRPKRISTRARASNWSL